MSEPHSSPHWPKSAYIGLEATMSDESACHPRADSARIYISIYLTSYVYEELPLHLKLAGRNFEGFIERPWVLYTSPLHHHHHHHLSSSWVSRVDMHLSPGQELGRRCLLLCIVSWRIKLMHTVVQTAQNPLAEGMWCCCAAVQQYVQTSAYTTSQAKKHGRFGCKIPTALKKESGQNFRGIQTSVEHYKNSVAQ